jgi:eukaryotic-like serine/threonine-protein kinase
MIPQAGQRFGPYEILGRLGGGGMGLVFRAWDERLHREVAIKLLHDSYRMPGMRERFLQEARAASGLNHPNICTVFDIGEQDGNPYLVMELLEGETLRTRIERGALSAEEIVRHALEITDALSVAHAKGIVHRDIKPANIFLVKMPTGRSQAKVLDFGLAKIALETRGGWESRTLDLTLAGATVGTIAYMSPEQARGESLDMRSDLFSLGTVMYEMATRHVPFEGTTSALLFVQLFSHTPESVRTWNESIPRELERVILKLLAKDRKERFQTAKELSEALTRVGSKLGRGGWLHKGSVAAVPLVRAYDPMARHKGFKRKSEEIEVPTSSDNKKKVRPTRGSTEDLGGPELTSPRLAQGSALAVESGELQVQPQTDSGMEAQPDASVNAVEVRRDSLDKNPVIAGTGDSGVHSGGDLEDTGFQDSSLWSQFAGSEIDDLAVEQAQRKRMRIRSAIVAAVVVLVVAGVFLMVGSGLFSPIVLRPSDRLLLTLIQNKTADKTLDGTLMQGLEIALRQSKRLNVLGGEAYRAGLRQLDPKGNGAMTAVPVQSVAQKIGAKAYLYGEITGSKAPYTISVDVLETDSNDKMTSVKETAVTREEIPLAISRLAQALRIEVSEDSKADARRSVPLEREASGNIDALHAYATAEMAMETWRTEDAMKAYQVAVALDPKFIQAQMRLSWLYRDEKAEVASADAATLAQNSAAHASENVKLLAQFCYEINASGNVDKATKTIREYAARYSLDANGKKGLALALRMQGLMPEAFQAAQQANSLNSFDAETYVESELDLIGMDRYGSAQDLETQALHSGVVQSANVLTAAYLGGKESVVEEQVGMMQKAIAGVSAKNDAKVTYAGLYSYGLYLDNTGKRSAGLELWRAAIAKAGTDSTLTGTQASLLAQGALDHALAESCTVALEMVEEGKSLPKGPVASFNAGMAAALCGDAPYAEKTILALQQNFPQGTAVAQYYVPELRAAAEIGVNEPEKALPDLDSLGAYDQISLAPYLRGMAHEAIGQMALAILDFQIVLAHRGGAFMLQGDAYPMAQIGVARAYASSRKKAESASAYRSFLTLWEDADRRQSLMVEALAKSK